VIIPDVNLLVYAHNRGVAEHERAREWWERIVNGAEPVGIDWAVALGFVRLMSNRHVVANPQPPHTLLARVAAFLAAPAVRLVAPGHRHAETMLRLFEETGAGPRLVTDTHLAALALELDAVLATNDSDFARFNGLRTVNPLA
jgi:uncharacterized protein